MTATKFWEWFLAHEHIIRRELTQQSRQVQALQIFYDNLSKYSPELGCTFHSEKATQKIYCHITLHNARASQMDRRHLLNHKPHHPSWEFREGIPPHDPNTKDPRELEFTCDTITIKTKQIYYQLVNWIEQTNQFEVVVYLPVVFSTLSESRTHTFVYLILETLYRDAFISKYIYAVDTTSSIQPDSNVRSLDNLKLEIECFFDSPLD